MADPPIARSPIAPPPPVAVRAGWEVSARRSRGTLRLADRSPLSKVHVRADRADAAADQLGVPAGRARRDTAGTLIVGSGPGEWLLVDAPRRAGQLMQRLGAVDEALVTVLDVTHGRAMLRLTGARSDAVLGKVCGVDFCDRATPNGTALRSSLARLVSDIVRDDIADVRSYLLHCERSSGQHLYDTLLDAGREFGIEPDGFVYPEE
jgi:heterotetrameric sarcosine oxidase gamma subunit